MFDLVMGFFAGEGWAVKPTKDHRTIHMNYQGDNGVWGCTMLLREEDYLCLFYSRSPLIASAAQMQLAAEFVLRANCGLPVGNFEIDLDDGTMLFKTSIDVEGQGLSLPLVRQLVVANVTMMDRYLPGIKALIEDNASAKAALAMVEG